MAPLERSQRWVDRLQCVAKRPDYAVPCAVCAHLWKAQPARRHHLQGSALYEQACNCGKFPFS